MAIPDFNIQPMPPIDISTGLRFLQQQQENLMKEASDFMNARARMEQAQVDRETNAVRMAQLAEDRRQFDLKMPLLQQQADTDKYEAVTDRQELQEEKRQFDLDAENRRRDSQTSERNSMTNAKLADIKAQEFADRENEQRRKMQVLGQEWLMQQSKERVASLNKSTGRFRSIAEMFVGAMKVITTLIESSTRRQVAALEARSRERYAEAIEDVADKGLEGDKVGAEAQVTAAGEHRAGAEAEAEAKIAYGQSMEASADTRLKQEEVKAAALTQVEEFRLEATRLELKGDKEQADAVRYQANKTLAKEWFRQGGRAFSDFMRLWNTTIRSNAEIKTATIRSIDRKARRTEAEEAERLKAEEKQAQEDATAIINQFTENADALGNMVTPQGLVIPVMNIYANAFKTAEVSVEASETIAESMNRHQLPKFINALRDAGVSPSHTNVFYDVMRKKEKAEFKNLDNQLTTYTKGSSDISSMIRQPGEGWKEGSLRGLDSLANRHNDLAGQLGAVQMSANEAVLYTEEGQEEKAKLLAKSQLVANEVMGEMAVLEDLFKSLSGETVIPQELDDPYGERVLSQLFNQATSEDEKIDALHSLQGFLTESRREAKVDQVATAIGMVEDEGRRKELMTRLVQWPGSVAYMKADQVAYAQELGLVDENTTGKATLTSLDHDNYGELFGTPAVVGKNEETGVQYKEFPLKMGVNTSALNRLRTLISRYPAESALQHADRLSLEYGVIDLDPKRASEARYLPVENNPFLFRANATFEGKDHNGRLAHYNKTRELFLGDVAAFVRGQKYDLSDVYFQQTGPGSSIYDVMVSGGIAPIGQINALAGREQ